MADLTCDLGRLKLKNPVMTASGTFGYGREYHEYFDISKLGVIGGPQQTQVTGLSGTAVPVGSMTGEAVPVNTITAERKSQLFGITSFGNQAIVQVVATSPFKRLAAFYVKVVRRLVEQEHVV